MTPRQTLIDSIQSAPQRELYFFSLYRALEAGILAGLIFSPLSGLVGEPRAPLLGTALAMFYLVFAVLMILLGRRSRRMAPLVMVSVTVDIAVAALATYALPPATAGIAMMLLVNVSAAALLLPARLGNGVAAAATAALLTEYIVSNVFGSTLGRPLAEMSMFSITYLAVGYLASQTGQRARSSEALADQRGVEVANLFEVNELIIRRMRTGVLVVDDQNCIRLANEAASQLLGDGTDERREDRKMHLPNQSPELARRLQRWRNSGQHDETPMQLNHDQAEVQPRFARLMVGSELSLVFLDDATVVSRRAESLTLSALGRFSASLAHEIRNPLAAINYAVQLLEESTSIIDGDRRLLEIIHQQCKRTNGIVESVLGLARRERATPEHMDLNAYVRHFTDEFRQHMSIETDSLEVVAGTRDVPAVIDVRHLQQMLTVLIQNALNYGRLPGEPARVRVRIFQAGGRPSIDVLDRGPGVPEAVASQLFRPFYTTSEHGTGLGLYIARELARANQATLDYVPVPGGGSCFRITMAGPHALVPA